MALTSGRRALVLAGALVVLLPGTADAAAPAPVPRATSSAAPSTVTRADALRSSTASAAAGVAATPYLGWSSWSWESTKYPGGGQKWLTEPNLLKQVDALATTLKPYGYRYVNIDAGWSATPDWVFHFDANGREEADPQRFPHGMKWVADYIHAKGLKAGIYLPVGLEIAAYRDGRTPIADAPGCTTEDIVYPDLRTTNGWDSAYKIDFSDPCGQKFIDSYAKLIAGWGFDFLKVDGVGPGSFKSGDNYDNRADVAAWRAAIDRTRRPIHFELSWSLDRNHAADWKKYGNGWRIDTDVECYCDTLVSWDSSVKVRWDEVPGWTPWAGPGGWNDLDSLDVGNGAIDGLTEAERQSYLTLWAISAAPLYTGDDLTRLDAFGRSLLTNREVLAIDQQGIPSRPVTPTGTGQVWGARNSDGSYTVALFNLGSFPATVGADWSSFGFAGRADVRDVWQRRDLGTRDGGISAPLPAHGSRLFTVRPRLDRPKVTTYEAESAANTLAEGAAVADCASCSGGRKVGSLYNGGALRINKVTVPRTGTYRVNFRYLTGDARSATVSANGQNPVTYAFGSSGGWDLPATVTISLNLHAGANTVEIDSSTPTYSPDIDRIEVPALR
jgi:alpha galactosidase A-like protein/alpha galactosidase C-like protein/carbohydrate binding protein with CBM35 domain